MKTLILALLLVPLITFAHGKTPPVCTPDTVGSSPRQPDSPPPVVPTPPQQPPVLSPVPSKTTPTEGGSQIWCSGPTAPGWNVSLPNGGCSSVIPKPIVIHLNQLPRTGLTFWQWLWQLL